MSFEEKLKQRIRDSVGELMTDEDLKKILERSIDEYLFKPRHNPSKGSFGSDYPPFIEECIKRQMESKVSLAVDKWARDNPDKIDEAVQKVILMGIAGCVETAMGYRFSYMFQEIQQRIAQNR